MIRPLRLIKIKPRRTLRAQRELRKVEQVIFTKPFAVSASSAVNKNKTAESAKDAEFLAASASMLYRRSMEVEDDKKIF